MREAGYEPLEPYPGWFVPWRFRCSVCGTEGATRAHGVRQRGGGCKTCARKRSGAASRLDPDVVAAKMRERGLEPLEPYPGAAVPWPVRCMVCGDESRPKWSKVQNRGDGCKTCGKKRAADAKRIDPEAAAAFVRALGYEPLEPFTSSKKSWPMTHIECGRVVTPKWDNLKSGQGGCSECGRERTAAARRNDPSEAAQEMASMGFVTLEPYRASDVPWLVQCSTCGTGYATTLNSARAGATTECRACTYARVGRERRVPTAEARAVMERCGLTPHGPFPGTHELWKCTCRVCGDETAMLYTSARLRLSKSPEAPAQGCETCVNVAIGDERRMSPQEAEQRLLAAGMRPLEPYRGVAEKWLAVCLTCGTESRISTAHAFSRGRACRTCGIKSRSDAQRKADDEAVATMVASGFQPLEPYKNTNSPWRSIHLLCGQEVAPRLTSLAKGRSCAVCAGKQIVPGYNDLATTHPDLARQMSVDKGYDPTTFGAGSGRKVLWRCDNGHEWKAAIGSRTGTGTGCPVCAGKGFNPSAPGWLYLMRHDAWEMLQVGITNEPTERTRTHARNGWEALDIRGPMDGVLAQEWERAILGMLRARGVELTGSGAAEQPTRTGKTRRNGEAWWCDDLATFRLRDLMDAVEVTEVASRRR